MRTNTVLKTLWHLRLEKMAKLEEDAAWEYQEILDECLEAFGADSPLVHKLKILVKEERMHKKIVDDMLEICHATHPEIGLL